MVSNSTTDAPKGHTEREVKNAYPEAEPRPDAYTKEQKEALKEAGLL